MDWSTKAHLKENLAELFSFWIRFAFIVIKSHFYCLKCCVWCCCCCGYWRCVRIWRCSVFSCWWMSHINIYYCMRSKLIFSSISAVHLSASAFPALYASVCIGVSISCCCYYLSTLFVSIDLIFDIRTDFFFVLSFYFS